MVLRIRFESLSDLLKNINLKEAHTMVDIYDRRTSRSAASTILKLEFCQSFTNDSQYIVTETGSVEVSGSC